MRISKYICHALLVATFVNIKGYCSEMDTQTIEKTHTTTVYSQSRNCNESSISKICSFFKNIYISSFEHDYIRFLTNNLDYSNELDDSFFDRTRAFQRIETDYKIAKNSQLVSVIARVEQEYLGKKVNFTDVHNVNLNTSKIIEFKDLFEDSKLAATLCANEIYLKYSALGYKKVAVIKALYENKPINFIIRKNGLEFILDGANIGLKDEKTSVFVSIEKLMLAKPYMEYFTL